MELKVQKKYSNYENLYKTDIDIQSKSRVCPLCSDEGPSTASHSFNALRLVMICLKTALIKPLAEVLNIRSISSLQFQDVKHTENSTILTDFLCSVSAAENCGYFSPGK